MESSLCDRNANQEKTMITDKEVRALAARLSERTALRYMGNCKCGHCALVDVADLKMAVSVLTELAATHKPDVVPGLERALRIVRESDFLVDADAAITEAIEVATSPSPEDLLDDHARESSLDGLPQP
jgi:hypothetical protein